MIDKNGIIQDLKSRKYTQGQIAQRHGCSISTVFLVAKKHNLSPGQGVRNYWEFTEVTHKLSYLVGVYLTDGCITRGYESRKITAFRLQCADEDFAQYTQECISSIGLKFGIGNYPSNGMGNKIRIVTSCYSSMFAQWLYDITDNKQKIPNLIFDSGEKCILEFIAACIDGDGGVEKDGSITVYNTSAWIFQFADLIRSIGIKTTGTKKKQSLESGKTLYKVSVRRSDFRELGGECKIKRKQDRILYGKDKRTWRRPKRYKYICPTCDEKVMSRKDAKQCQQCHFNSDELKERLRNQASKAGIAGCKARWG